MFIEIEYIRLSTFNENKICKTIINTDNISSIEQNNITMNNGNRFCVTKEYGIGKILNKIMKNKNNETTN